MLLRICDLWKWVFDLWFGVKAIGYADKFSSNEQTASIYAELFVTTLISPWKFGWQVANFDKENGQNI